MLSQPLARSWEKFALSPVPKETAMRLFSVSWQIVFWPLAATFALASACGSAREYDEREEENGGSPSAGGAGGVKSTLSGGVGGTLAARGGGTGQGGVASNGLGGQTNATLGGSLGSGGDFGEGGRVNWGSGGIGGSGVGGATPASGGSVNGGGSANGGAAAGGRTGTGGASSKGGASAGGAQGSGGATAKGGSGSGGAMVDPCANNGGCNVNATCAPSGSSRTCTCKSGFSGDGQSCTDVNECQTNNGGCHTNATCTNTSGSRTCACKSGFTGNGTSCTDVNECQSANGGCDTNAVCTNTSGSRTCACSEGFTGNGLTCTLVPPPTAVSIWKFERQSTATRVLDSRGSNHGTVVTGNELVSPPAATAPVFAPDRDGVASGALRLDGVTSQNWVSVPHSTSLNSPWANNAITMTIWVRMMSVPASGGVGLLDRGGNQDTTTFSLGLFNGKPQLRMDNYTASGSVNMPVNAWTFLAGVYNGTALTLYVNGEVAGSFGNVGVPLVSLSGQLTIGASQNIISGYPTGFPNGDIDEVRLYGAALSAPQVRVVMQE